MKSTTRTAARADEVDVLIEDSDGLPYALWEVKPPAGFATEKTDAIKNQLFGTAPLVGAPKLLVYATILAAEAKASIELLCIDYAKFKSYDAWITAGSPHTTTFPADYQDLDYKPFVNGGEPDLKLDCTQAEFRAVAASVPSSVLRHLAFASSTVDRWLASLLPARHVGDGATRRIFLG